MRKPFFFSQLVLSALIAIPAGTPRLRAQTPDSSSNIPQLMQTLAGAYSNSIRHDVPSADLASEDLNLEADSIQLSFEMFSEIGQSACASAKAENLNPDDSKCGLHDRLEGLPGLASSVSYAAYRLENLEASLGADPASGEQALTLAHLRAMEHLYRMVFTLSGLFLDSPQSVTYLESAHEQLQFARSYMEREETLCRCEPQGYPALLLELSQLNDEINALRSSSLP